MADPMNDGIHYTEDSTSSDVKELKLLMEDLIRTVSKLSSASTKTATHVEDLLDVLEKNAHREARVEDRIEEVYKQDDKIQAIDRTLNILSESIKLNDETVRLFMQNTKNMAEATKAIAMDRDAYDARVKTAKEGLKDQRDYSNKTMVPDLLRASMKSLFGFAPGMKENQEVQRADLSAMRSSAYKTNKDLRNVQLQDYVIGKDESTEQEEKRRSKYHLEQMKNYRKQELFSNFFNRTEGQPREGMYNQPAAKAHPGRPAPLLLEGAPGSPPLNDLGRGEGVIPVSPRKTRGQRRKQDSDDFHSKRSKKSQTGRPNPRMLGGNPGSIVPRKSALQTQKALPGSIVPRMSDLKAQRDAITGSIGQGTSQGFFDLPQGGKNTALIKAFTQKSTLKPTASDVAEASPAAFATGFLYLGGLIKEAAERAEDNMEDLDMGSTGGGGGVGEGVMGATVAKLLTSAAVIAGIQSVLAVGSIVAGIGLIAYSIWKNRDKTDWDYNENAVGTNLYNGGTPANQPNALGVALDQSKLTAQERMTQALNAYDPEGMNVDGTRAVTDQKILQKDMSSNQRGILSDMINSGIIKLTPEKHGKYLDSFSRQELQQGYQLYHTQKKLKTPFEQIYHTGGMVPGPVGSEQSAKVLGGEVYLSPPESKAFASNLQKIVDNLSSISPEATSAGNSNEELLVALRKHEELLGELVTELKRNTDITDRKELKVETPSVPPSPSRQYQRVV
jgi:hypothetical protein